MGDLLNGVRGLDIHEEEKVVRDKLSELRLLGASEKEIKDVMKDLGLTRCVKIKSNILFIYVYIFRGLLFFWGFIISLSAKIN